MKQQGIRDKKDIQNSRMQLGNGPSLEGGIEGENSNHIKPCMKGLIHRIFSVFWRLLTNLEEVVCYLRLVTHENRVAVDYLVRINICISIRLHHKYFLKFMTQLKSLFVLGF